MHLRAFERAMRRRSLFEVWDFDMDHRNSRQRHRRKRTRARRNIRTLKAPDILPDEEAALEEEDPQPLSWRELMEDGKALMKQGRAAEAAEAFCRACDLRPDHVITVQHLGAALLSAGDPQGAAAWFEEGLGHAPGNPLLLHGKGVAYHAMGARGQALDAFRSTVSRDADAWASWQSIADLTPDENERLQGIDAAADALLRACARPTAAGNDYFRCATALIEAHRFDEAVRFTEKHFHQFAHPRIAHNKLASAHYRRGAFADAFFHKLRALQCLTLDDIGSASQQAIFDPDAALAALADIYAILEAASVSAFLAAGTLLGFVRNGGPLPYDRDVDLGVLPAGDGGPDIARILREHPALMLSRAARPGDRYFALTHKSIGIDIFVYANDDDALTCGFSLNPGDIQWRFSAFDAVPRTFKDRSFRTPADVQRYLAETYGPEWRRADKGYASAISSPALSGVDDYARAFYSVARAERSLLLGDREKAEALISQSPIRIDFTAPTSSSAVETSAPGTAANSNEENH